MIISRLDKIIENNVTASTQKNNEAQKIAILQDISETLAMIYDKLCGMNAVSDATVPVESMAVIIDFFALNNFDSLYFEPIDFPEGYEVRFLRYEEEEIIDAKHNQKQHEYYVVLLAFGEEMRLKESDYNKKWRCWNVKPLEDERKKNKWTK